ncbi:ATP-binding cassette domain-containing protein [Oscillospiraceae bacterium OttesenSCG-928-G22]|nr:ATP-binding cassette domain-containing protein [Oscillospiraceae bacterium OttesenSCG-928-G22]
MPDMIPRQEIVANSAPVLAVTELTKLYKNGRGIENMSFSVDRGDVLGLLGPNGSGKTTAMKAIVGLCHFQKGDVRIFGHSVAEEYEKAMARVGCLIEAPALYLYMTAYQNMKLAARHYPGTTAEDVNHLLKLVGLSRYQGDKVERFSLGMKQRLGLALALLGTPELVILDEPVNGLDIEGMIEIREIIKKLAAEKGVSFFISSHLAAEIEKTCNKVAVVHEGEMLSFDTVEEALRLNPSLEDYFLNKVREKRGAVI